jgi:hypothetical protein
VIVAATVGAQFLSNPDGLFMGSTLVERALRFAILQQPGVVDVQATHHAGVFEVVSESSAVFDGKPVLAVDVINVNPNAFDYERSKPIHRRSQITVTIEVFG